MAGTPDLRVSEFPTSLTWLNTSRPITIDDLKGNVSLLVFWRYSSVNCLHLIAEIKQLQKMFMGQLSIIWIHSPKFKTEGELSELESAIDYLKITDPVANDPDFALWRACSIRAWPSILALDPQGKVIGLLRGEGRQQQLEEIIRNHVAVTDMDRNRLPVLEAKNETELFDVALRFPGKVYVTREYVYIADSGHHRIIEAYHSGEIKRIFGSGVPALVNGREQQACFHYPQGMTQLGEFLFVSDTGNHAIRRIHLSTGEVLTVAGNGKQGRYIADQYTHSDKSLLNSPWDICHYENTLYIAMAGQHQIWSMNVKSDGITRIAGTGREDIFDGEAKEACFAKPVGLALMYNKLYVADADTSSIRLLDPESMCVNTLAGGGLFVYGDREGIGGKVRFQHPMAVAADPGRNAIWVADTYNSRIKRLDITTLQVSRYPVDYELDNPAGLSLHDDILYIANTNAHQIVCLDLKTRETREFVLHEVEETV